ncbi:hypothetical protein [Nonomuraea zeae]|uniref:Uncharacterized protein n=1 Tax=Nonomuraea zeae TaxID=1642303 RepID=A0A5S4FYT8_9ACTN|nr:hypothetical protein [Nonomuraea zeae]TMR25868.1 hypothetical protein ETD85_44415 [Nonomuraea zeae]
MQSTTTRRRLLGLGAAALATGAILAGQAGPAQAAIADVEIKMTLCVVDQVTPRIDCKVDARLPVPVPVDGLFARNFSTTFQPSGSPLEATYKVRVTRSATGAPVIAQATQVLLRNKVTSQQLGVTSGSQVQLPVNQQRSNSTTVVDTVNFPVGTPTSQANNATGNFAVTWHVS